MQQKFISSVISPHLLHALCIYDSMYFVEEISSQLIYLIEPTDLMRAPVGPCDGNRWE